MREAYRTSLPGRRFGIIREVLLENRNSSLQLGQQRCRNFNRVLGSRDVTVNRPIGPIGILLLNNDELMTIALGNLNGYFSARADTEAAYFLRVLLKVLQTHMDFLLYPASQRQQAWL